MLSLFFRPHALRARALGRRSSAVGTIVLAGLFLPSCDTFPNPLTGEFGDGGQQLQPTDSPGADVVGDTYDLRQIGLNVGTATARDFQLDPLTAGTNPLGANETILTKRSELALFSIHDQGTRVSGDVRFLGDELEGQAVLPNTSSVHSFDRRIRAAISADIDGDAKDEVIVASAISGGLILHRVDQNASGQYIWTEYNRVTNMGFPAADVSLAAGDVDGDRRDEIVVVGLRLPKDFDGNDAAIRIVDDPEDGGGYLLDRQIQSINQFGTIGNFVRYSCTATDLDGDGFDEVVLGRQGSGLSSTGRNNFHMSVYRASPGSGGLSLIVDEQAIHASPFNLFLSGASLMTPGQFDSDPEDEIMVASALGVEGEAYFRFYQLDLDVQAGALVLARTTQFSGLCHTEPSLPDSFAACAVDRFGSGDDEYAFFRKPIGEQSTVRLIRWVPGVQSWSSEAVFDDVFSFPVDALSLEAGDADADGAEELFASYSWMSGDQMANWVYAIEDGGNPSNRRIADYTSALDGPARPLQIVPGDFDADGFEIRFTGQRDLVVSNPVPIALLAAVPTKAGISQNTLFSGTSYEVGVGSGIETSLITTSTITAKVGAEYEDITGLFGGSAKATMERESRTTNATASRVTEITGYTSAFDADVIVFSAHMYLTHEYEIVSAPLPSVIGDRFTIDQPIATNVYKWTVPFYNAQVPTQYAIGPDLLPHTIGRPETYRRDFEMSAVTGPVVSWQTSAPITVGQGGGFTSNELNLETENTTTQQREVDLGAEASFKAYGVFVEGSFSTGKGSAYTVITNASTSYRAVVGDIVDPVDYQDWRFNWAMHVYQPWRLSDSNNQPTGQWLPGGYPLTVIDFWTDPVGDRY